MYIEKFADQVFIDYAVKHYSSAILDYPIQITRSPEKVILKARISDIPTGDNSFSTTFVFTDQTCSFDRGPAHTNVIVGWADDLIAGIDDSEPTM